MDFGGEFLYIGESEDEELSATDESDKDEDDIWLEAPGPSNVQGVSSMDMDSDDVEPHDAEVHQSGGLFRTLRGLLGDRSREEREIEFSKSNSNRRVLRKKLKRVKKLDGNVVNIDFSALSNEASLSTGDIVLCESCGASLSVHSKLDERTSTTTFQQDAGDPSSMMTWSCEFCGNVNFVELFREEIPQNDVVDYFIEPGESVEKASESLVILVVDISGSMCVTKEVSGSINLKTSDVRSRNLARAEMEDGDQFLPSQNRQSSYISRLDCLRAALLDMLETMNESTSVCLITFNNEVCIIGDGVQKEIWIRGDRLSDYNQIYNLAKEFGEIAPLKQSKESLSKKIIDLEENGATALGPAVVSALACASKSATSKIIICTDGLANIGVGDLEEGEDAVYSQVSGEARELGVPISIISIEGDGCSIETIGEMADATGGDVTIVDPMTLGEDFYHILQNPLVATGVVVKVILHQYLELVEEDVSEFSVGNVTEESSLQFRCKVKKDVDTSEMEDGIPFQVQITYTNARTKAKNMRVITRFQKHTVDRDVANQNLNHDILGAAVMQKAATLAQTGDYSRAHRYASAYENLLNKSVVEENEKEIYRQAFTPLKTNLENQLYDEADMGIGYAENSDESEDETVTMRRQSSRKQGRKKMDVFSKEIYSAKKMSPQVLRKKK